MNPFEEYIAIIHNRQQDPLPKGQYGEVHHIIPRSCGGCNKKWNKVKLTPEEHYRCHYLLTFLYATGEEHEKMVCAWNALKGTHKGLNVSQSEYGSLKREYSALMSRRFKGVKKSEEQKKKASISLKGKSLGRQTFLGQHHSEEAKQKNRLAHLGKEPWNKGKKFGPTGKPGPFKGRKHTEEWCKEHAQKMKEFWAKRKAVS